MDQQASREPSGMDSEALARQCVEICQDRKAEDIVLFDVRASSILADYYLICTGTSAPHINAIATHLRKTLSELGVDLRGREGDAASQWVVLDYGTLLVHVLDPERRSFYKIEELWKGNTVIARGKQPAIALA